jgi:PAS domain S-box-containing protein
MSPKRPRLEAARDGILILDAESEAIVEADPFLTAILGCSREELLGRPLAEIGLLAFCLRCDGLLEKVRREGYCRCESLPLKTRDGRRIFVEFVGTSYSVDERTMFQFNVGDVRESLPESAPAAR